MINIPTIIWTALKLSFPQKCSEKRIKSIKSDHVEVPSLQQSPWRHHAFSPRCDGYMLR